MHTGPLGSTIHVLHADPQTVIELASIDWNRSFRRVCLDPVRGVITLMAPSRLHEELARTLDHVVDVAASALTGAVKGLLDGAASGTRCRGRLPPVRAWSRTARSTLVRRPGPTAPRSRREKTRPMRSLTRTPPTWWWRSRITSANESKIERYADLGVRELWLLQAPEGSGTPHAEFLALRPGTAPRRLASSAVLRSLTPDDVCEAIVGVRLSVTRDERTEAVARIVRRRQRSSVRVREADTPYAARSG